MTDKLDTAAIRAQMEALDGFTPGPWGYRPNEFDDWGDVRGGDGFRICQARDRRYMSDEYLSACRTSKVDPWEENARLIAAAPDMRETILALCDALDELRADNERLRDALSHVVAIHDRSMHDADTNADDMAHYARAALAQKEGE